MSKVIPSQVSGYQVGGWLVRSTIFGSIYQGVIRDQNRIYGDRGARVGSLFPVQVPGVPHWETTSTAYTQNNDLLGDYGEAVELSNFSPWFRLGRRLGVGGGSSSLVLEIEVEAQIQNMDLLIGLRSSTGGALANVLLTSSTRATVGAAWQITEAAASGGTAGDPLVQFGLYAQARIKGGASGTGTAYLYTGPTVYERMLETSEAAKLPRGY
jgi:hypothetical protein